MYTIDEINDLLDEVAADLPGELFRDLNGGVCLLPEVKLSEADPDGGLYTLGEYRRDQMGRYIVIYYGSVCAVHGDAPRDVMREKLRKLLGHELTHHLESLSGERDLEIEDRRNLAEYLRGK
ncbi:MAG: metallopeptidase family protein [Oscillospiraceae bacterium]|nr:metallopeptidase family protein [Oscillospiraceae bacterium]